jgi:hypothetical protein
MPVFIPLPARRAVHVRRAACQHNSDGSALLFSVTSPAIGSDLDEASYERDPLVVAVVDVGEGAVTEIRTPPSHVKWGDISTPMF